MRLPIFKSARPHSASQVTAFRGLNWGEEAGPGELWDSKGLTARHYPFLSARPGRETVHVCASSPSNALFAWNKLVEVDGNTLLYDGEAMCSVNAEKKQFAVVNNKLVVWPDKLVLDMDERKLRDFSSQVTSAEGTTVIWTEDGVELSPYAVTQTGVFQWPHQAYQDTRSCHRPFLSFLSFERRSDDPDWDLEFDEGRPGSGRQVLRVGSRLAAQRLGMGQYAPITRTSTFVKGDNHNVPWAVVTPWNGTPVSEDTVWLLVTAIRATEHREGGELLWWDVTMDYEVADGSTRTEDLRDSFAQGDRITIRGSQTAERVRIKSVEEGKITLDSAPFTPGQDNDPVTIAHDVPELDFICAKDNRLWGFSNAEQTIYSSALGMPMDFYDYAETSDASYAVAIVSPGDVTGMTVYSGAVLLWKADTLYKVMGEYPANYAYYTYNVNGVAKGSHGSQVILNEVLYFLGEEGVYAYTGGVPQLISGAFGNRRFSDGVAGTDGTCLLLSMKDKESKEYGLYTYDTLRGIWLKEDGTEVAGFARLDRRTYMLSRTDSTLYILNAGGDERVEWMAELAPLRGTAPGCVSLPPERRGYSKLWLRLNMDDGAWFMVETRQDLGEWKRVWTQECSKAVTIELPLLPGRCDRFSVRLSGKGRTVVESMVLEYLAGSEKL